MFKPNSCQETGLNLNPSNNLHLMTYSFCEWVYLVFKSFGWPCLYDIRHIRLHAVYFIAAALAVDFFILEVLKSTIQRAQYIL